MRSAIPLLPFAAFLCIHGDSSAARAPTPTRPIPEAAAVEWKRALREAYAAGARFDYRAEAAALEPCSTFLRQFPDTPLAARTHEYLGAAHLGLLDYPRALRHLAAARTAHRRSGDLAGFAASSSNMSNLYFTLQALPEAIHAADDAAEAFSRLSDQRGELRVLVHKARLLHRTGDTAAASRLFRDAARKAQHIGDSGAAAFAWYMEGAEALQGGDAARAAVPLRRALWQRWSMSDPGLSNVLRSLALERLRAGDGVSAAALAGRARDSRPASSPDWTIPYARALALRKAGADEEAFLELESATAQVRKFHLEQMPAPLRTAASAGLHRLYSEVVSLAARLYEKTGDKAMLEETLDAAAADQALGLRGTVAGKDTHPGGLDRLQAAYSAMFGDPGSKSVVSRLRMELIEREAESIPDQTPVEPARPSRRVEPGAAILVFHTGPEESFRWTISSAGIALARLPAEATLERAVGAFRREAEQGAAGPAGRELTRLLFDGLEPAVLAAPRWRVVPSGALFRVPFGALAPPPSQAGAYLIQAHSVRVVPAFWMFDSPPTDVWHGEPLALADPVYNRADPRFRGAAGGPETSPALPRLPGGRAEARRAMEATGRTARILTGNDAAPGPLAAAFEARPGILHFAAHVVPAPDQPDESLLALSLDEKGRFRHLSAEWIAAREVRCALVVMSSCRSGSGQIRPGDGLLGLTRAWLEAGAATVVATHWPTPDDSGDLLERFHTHRRTLGGPEEDALRAAVLDLLARGDWRARPDYWGGFFVIGRPNIRIGPSKYPQLEN